MSSVDHTTDHPTDDRATSPAPRARSRDTAARRSATRARQMASPPVVLARPGGGGNRPRIGPLSRFMKLAIWGESLLTEPAVHQMRSAAFVLLIVFLFELSAWSLLFNVIVNGGVWEFTDRTGFALGFGLLFAGVVFLWERGFVTMDALRRPWRTFLMAVARLALIGLSIVATTQSIEVLVFQQEIEARLIDEAAREEAHRQLRLIEQTEGLRVRAQAQLVDSEEKKGLEEARRAYEEATQLQKDLTSARSRREAMRKLEVERLPEQRARVQRARQAVQELANQVDDAIAASGEGSQEVTSARAALLEAEADLSRAQSAQRRTEDGIKSLRERSQTYGDLVDSQTNAVEVAKTRYDEAQRAYDEVVQEAKQALQGDAPVSAFDRIEWVQEIARASPGGGPHYAPGEEAAWDPSRASFVRRWLVLRQLLAGKPARWPPVDEETKAKMISTFGLLDLAEVEAEHLQDDAQSLVLLWWGAFVVAGFVPLLAIIYKLMMRSELALYYSVGHQAAFGNRDARLLYPELALRSGARGAEAVVEAPPEPQRAQIPPPTLTLQGDPEEVTSEKREQIQEALRLFSGDPDLVIREIHYGSVVLTVESKEEALRLVQYSIDQGILVEVGSRRVLEGQLTVTAPPAPSPEELEAHRQRALSDLLRMLFDLRELRRWILEIPGGKKICDGLPEPLSLAEAASQIASSLMRQGVDVEVFGSLLRARPRQMDNICVVAQYWRFTSTDLLRILLQIGERAAPPPSGGAAGRLERLFDRDGSADGAPGFFPQGSKPTLIVRRDGEPQ